MYESGAPVGPGINLILWITSRKKKLPLKLLLVVQFLFLELNSDYFFVQSKKNLRFPQSAEFKSWTSLKRDSKQTTRTYPKRILIKHFFKMSKVEGGEGLGKRTSSFAQVGQNIIPCILLYIIIIDNIMHANWIHANCFGRLTAETYFAH